MALPPWVVKKRRKEGFVENGFGVCVRCPSSAHLREDLDGSTSVECGDAHGAGKEYLFPSDELYKKCPRIKKGWCERRSYEVESVALSV